MPDFTVWEHETFAGVKTDEKFIVIVHEVSNQGQVVVVFVLKSQVARDRPHGKCVQKEK